MNASSAALKMAMGLKDTNDISSNEDATLGEEKPRALKITMEKIKNTAQKSHNRLVDLLRKQGGCFLMMI